MGNSVPDPGPPTWKEALDGAQHERAKAGDLARRTKDSIGRMASDDAAGRAGATGLLLKAESEWSHFNGYAAKASAFIRVHPALADSSIYAPCPHVVNGSKAQARCYTGPDDGWYRAPGAATVANDYHEREPGDDDE